MWKGIFLLFAAFFISVGMTIYQVFIPNIESQQIALFQSFEELERLGAYVIGADGENLGRIARRGANALGNKYDAGNPYKPNGLFNPNSKYGSPYSPVSAFNRYASDPPKVVIQVGKELYTIGLLTTNRYIATQVQRINPYLLRAWLESE